MGETRKKLKKGNTGRESSEYRWEIKDTDEGKHERLQSKEDKKKTTKGRAYYRQMRYRYPQQKVSYKMKRKYTNQGITNARHSS